MNDSIRVERREKRITVNDNGDYITIPLDSQDFKPGILALMRDLERRAKDQQQRAKDISDATAGAQDPGEYREKVEELAGLNLADCQELSRQVDNLFGDGACTKIFGRGVPSLFAFADFFEQLAPIVKKCAQEEAAAAQKRVNKYLAKYAKEGQ